MTDYGATYTGFRRKRAPEIMRSIKDYIRSPDGIGPDVPVDDSPFEELLGCFVAELDSAWQALEQTYLAFDPDAAQGAALDNLMALIGLSRIRASYSTGEVTITGDEGVVIPRGFEVKNGSTDARFVSTAEVTIGAGGTVDVPIRSRDKGPVGSEATKIDTAVTVLSGITGVSNADAVTVGRLEETDDEARIRRQESLQILGRGTLAGIEADLRQLSFVQAVRVIENDTGAPQNGQPPYSIRPVIDPQVSSGADQKIIAHTLWTHFSGVQFIGDVHATITDENGLEHQIRWDWAEPIRVFVTATLQVDDRLFPDDGEDQVHSAITDYIEGLQVGDDVKVIDLYTVINTVPGVVAADIKLGTTPSPAGTTNIPIAIDERAQVQDAQADILVVRT